jgi:superfamily II DNA or RNA helicase
VFTLRSYQKQVVANTYRHIRSGSKRILIFAPTGAGKTIIVTRVVSDAVARQRKVLFVVHREVLISQTFNKFSAAGLRCGFIKAGWPEDIDAEVQIASVQTLPKRSEWKELPFDLIIFDEAHLVAFSTICQQMMGSVFPDAIYLGLTATPWRLSSFESLGDIFSTLVCAPMPKELIKSGFLVKPSYYNLNFDVQLDELDLVDGDYNLNQLSATCDRPELIEQIITSWHDMAYSRPTKSKALYFQQLGRGLRLASDKFDCLVLDQSQNVIEHGFIEDLEEITLVPSDQKNSQKGATANTISSYKN